MGSSLLLYLAALALLGAGALYAVDRVAKAGTRGGDADISLETIFAAGLALTLVVVTVTVAAFTGAFFLIPALALAGAAVFVLAYGWRRARAAGDSAWRAEQITEEEARVAETARLDPANAAAWARLSELSEKKGDYASAIRQYRKVCELEPGEISERRLRFLRERASAELRSGGRD